MATPQPGRPVYVVYATSRVFWFSVFAVVLFAIAFIIAADWYHAGASKIADILTYLTAGSVFFAAAHVP
jgi:hypothetical protein